MDQDFLWQGFGDFRLNAMVLTRDISQRMAGEPFATTISQQASTSRAAGLDASVFLRPDRSSSKLPTAILALQCACLALELVVGASEQGLNR